jgi:hypothetical protein
LLFPRDVAPDSAAGRELAAALPAWRSAVLASAGERYEIARSVCRFALAAGGPETHL